MGLFFHLLPYGFILQAIAIVHFIRRRPDGYWIWVIIFFGGFGALVYIVAEVVPDLGLLRNSLRVFPRRQRIRELEALVRDNPSAGNYEELGGLYLDDGNYSRARECFTRAISSRTDSPDPFYRRALAELELKDYAAAVPDLELVVSRDASYDFHRAAGLLADAYRRTGNLAQADTLFARVSAFDLHRDPVPLCLIPGRAGSHGRCPRLGRADPGEKALSARIPKAPGASMVSTRFSLVAPALPRWGRLAKAAGLVEALVPSPQARD